MSVAWRALRPAKKAHDPWAAPAWQLEKERQVDGREATCLTVFLIGRECPFTCVFCDLWQHTIDQDTPPGALPAQLRLALAAASRQEGASAGALADGAPAQLLKLYNASNFFDAQAVPKVDEAAIVAASQGFERVVVESHARLLGPRCRHFAEQLEGRLQVAVGFETVAPASLSRLGKGIGVADLRRAGRFLQGAGISLRAFVLIGAPFLPRRERPVWTRRTCELALELGAEQVVLIPLRPSPGELARLVANGEVELPDLAEVTETVDLCAPLAPRRILLDSWDLERLTAGWRAENQPDWLVRLLRFAAGDSFEEHHGPPRSL